MTKPTKWHVYPAKTQISLGIRPVWSDYSLSAWRKFGSLATHWVHSEDSEQIGRMPGLLWVFTGHTVISLALSRAGSYLTMRRFSLALSSVAQVLNRNLTSEHFISAVSNLDNMCKPVAQLVECPIGFGPRPRHSKVVKNGTRCSFLSIHTATPSLEDYD